MSKMLITVFLFLCVGLIAATFLPLSGEKFLRIEDFIVKLNGEALRIEPRVHPSERDSEMFGRIYIYFNSKKLSENNCQFKATLALNNETSSQVIASCESDDKNCSYEFKGPHADSRMVMDIGTLPVGSIDLNVSFQNSSARTNTCPDTTRKITMVPEWYRINMWQKEFSR